MRRGSVRVVAAIALFCVLFPAAAVGGEPTVVRHPVYGGGEAFFGDCPSDPIPPAGTVCTDNYVLFWRGVTVIGGGSLATPDAPWQILAVTDRVEFDGNKWGAARDVAALGLHAAPR